MLAVQDARYIGKHALVEEFRYPVGIKVGEIEVGKPIFKL